MGLKTTHLLLNVAPCVMRQPFIQECHGHASLFLAGEAVPHTLLWFTWSALQNTDSITQVKYGIVFFLHMVYYRNATFRLSQVTKRKTFKTDHKNKL